MIPIIVYTISLLISGFTLGWCVCLLATKRNMVVVEEQATREPWEQDPDWWRKST